MGVLIGLSVVALLLIVLTLLLGFALAMLLGFVSILIIFFSLFPLLILGVIIP